MLDKKNDLTVSAVDRVKVKMSEREIRKYDDQNRELRKAKYESYKYVHNSKIQLEKH